MRAGNVFGPMFARCLHRLLVVASYSSVTMSDLEQSVLKRGLIQVFRSCGG